MKWKSEEPPVLGSTRIRAVFAFLPITDPDTYETFWLEHVRVFEHYDYKHGAGCLVWQTQKVVLNDTR